MPFQSEKQRRYLHANHPEIAKRWEKEYSHGGILDIDGSEEITTEEGNDISLVDESETGVSTLFKAKDGGTPQLAKKSKDGTRPGYKGSDWGPGAGSPGTTSTGQNVNTGGDGNTARERGIQQYHSRVAETAKEQQRKEDLSNLVKSGPGSWEEKFDTEKQIVQGAGATDLKRAQMKSTLVRDRVTPRINELREKINARFTPTKLAGNILSKSFPVLSVLSSMKDQWEISALTKELVEALEAEKEQHLKAGHAPFHHAVDTPIQTIDQEILDLTQKDTRDDEDTKGDGPEVPVVAPVTEEIEDSYAMAGDWLQSYRDLKAKQALSAQLQEKWADEREWQQETMFANSGGLANLFRVKNQ
jgi:hypothetical protein